MNPQKLRWMPHLMIPVQKMDDLEPLITNVNALALQGPMFFMQSLISKVSGGRTHNEAQLSRQERPETATSVTENSLARQSAMGLRGMFFQEGRQRIAAQVWSLWRQFGPEEFYAMVTGEPLRKMTQHQIRGDFTIIPRGAVADMDPNLRLQEAMQALDLLMKSMPLLQNDPRYRADLAQAVKDVMDRMDPTMSMRLLPKRSPEEMQQFVEQRQAEAQRLQAIADEARKLIEGAPVDPQTNIAALREIRAESPHKSLQPVIDAADQAQAAANEGAAILNGAQ